MAAGSENIESKVQSKLDLLLITSDPPEHIDSIHIIIPQSSNQDPVIQSLLTTYFERIERVAEDQNLKVCIYESGTRDADKEQFMEWSNRIRDEFSDEMILKTIEKIEIRPVVKAPYRYDTLEHKKIGDEAFEAFYGEIRQQEGADLLPYPNSDISGYDGNYPPMTFGSIVALAGDFFGIPDKPISEGKGKEAEKRFLDSTADLFGNKDRINLGLELLGIAYDHPFFIDAWYWWATRGKYIKLAQNNIDHFSPEAAMAYRIGHELAIEKAIEASRIDTNSPNALHNKKKLLEEALRFEAFACHYLTDSFSAGHLRVPRKALHDIGKDWDAKAQHDEDGRLGLEVEDHSSQKWRTFGDDQLIDSKGKKNEDELKKIAYGKVRDATTRAIKDIWESYKTQCQITKVYTLMLKEPCASNNHYAMFKIDNGVLKKRTGKENEDKYENYPPKGGCMIL